MDNFQPAHPHTKPPIDDIVGTEVPVMAEGRGHRNGTPEPSNEGASLSVGREFRHKQEYAKNGVVGTIHASKDAAQTSKSERIDKGNVTMRQLIVPNPAIPCTPGMCLEYVRETFGLDPKYPTATAGWQASNHRHTDQDIPADIWVPVWFSLSDNPDGHVALRQPDGSIWSSSSPTAMQPVHHPSLQDLERYYGGKLTYLGWTEDIENVAVVRG